MFYDVAMAFKELDPELARKAIEGFTNELASEARSLEAFYRQFRCKECGGEVRREAVRGHVFGESHLVPRSCLRCSQCRCLFDPHTGLVLERGLMTKAVPPPERIK